MKNKLLFILLLTFTFAQCQSKNSYKKVNVNNLNQTMITQNEIIELLEKQKLLENEETENQYTLSEKDLIVLSDLISTDLKNKGYRFPSPEEFNNRIYTLFSINTECTRFEKIGSRYIVFHGIIMDGKKKTLNENLYGSYVDTKNLFFDRKNLIILNFSLLNSIVTQNGQNISINIPEYIIHRNKYLFNDNKASLAWLKVNDTYFLESLVKAFGYTEDKDLLNWVMERNRKNSDDFLAENLFTKNCEGKLEIRKGILDHIEDNTNNDNHDYFDGLSNLYYSPNSSLDWDNFTKDEQLKMLGYLANTNDYLVMKYDQLGYDTSGRWTLLGSVFYNYTKSDNEQKWDELVQHFKKNNYYGLPHLEEAISYAYNYESGSY